MRLLGTLAAVPCVFSVYVAGEHGYLCSDAEGTTNTTYDQALVEKSVTDACLPDSELSAAELAANVEAKKYPQVWVNSEDYGFNDTVLLWKYQGNSSESLEEADVLVFTNKFCDILGLLQTSDDQYTICEDVKEQNDKKTSSEILSKKPRPGIFSGRGGIYDLLPGQGDSPDQAITIPQPHFDDFDAQGRRIPRRIAPQPYPGQGGGPPPSMPGPPMGGPPNMSGPPRGPPPNMSGPPRGPPPMQGPPGGFPPNSCGPRGCPPR
ncbi:BgtE-5690 [Blumeria graminis f. sp. tritici]|uniref:BgtE-5690 n=2 Tax=Blumeria graminis f. sp. tritici TaxID=62690 RepID=A0A061HNA4_BLUGR|nr:putative secreted effector protein [Blumeria graminis f. sp. tritici 96224]VDB85935.1 BgtE-5690 [Blumeria graminis f. sp. tritici]